MGRSKGGLPWNTGLPSERQPRFGKPLPLTSRLKLSHDRQGSGNPMWHVPPWNKGLTKDTNPIIQRLAEERIGKPHPVKSHVKGYTTSWKGKHHSEETKHKQSFAAKRRLTTKEGKTHLLMIQKKAQQAMKVLIKNGNHPSQRPTFKQIMKSMNQNMLTNGTHSFLNPQIRIKAQKAVAKSTRGQSWIEKKVGWLLGQLNLNKESQKPIPTCVDRLGVQHYIFIDWFLPDYKLAIECDGEYWHKDKQKEKQRDEIVKRNGFQILHLVGNMIRYNLHECENLILASIGCVAVVESTAES